jgi:hypothetical protein
VDVQGALELVERDAGQARQQVAHGVDAGVEGLGVGVDLDPVAGREHTASPTGPLERRPSSTSGASPSPTVTRSSSETGALRWEMPTTRTLTPTPRGRAPVVLLDQRDRLAVLVERQDLQLVRQVDLAHVDARRHRSSAGAKFRTLVMPASTMRSQTPARRRRASR